MSSFKKNLIGNCLIADCLNEDRSVTAHSGAQADEAPVTCESFENRVNELLDDRIDLTTDSVLRFHADQCSSCLATLQRYEQLELVLSSTRDDLGKTELKHRSDIDVAGVDQRQSKRWLKLSPTVAPLVAAVLVTFFVTTAQFFPGRANVGVGTIVEKVPTVAESAVKPQLDLLEIATPAVATAPAGGLHEIQKVWSPQGSVGQLRGLVDSGSEMFAAGRQQAAVIRGLSDVRLDLDLDLVETQLTALQPMLTYSGRIPALSPMQGTVCFTLGWLRKDKVEDQPKSQTLPDAGAELGMQRIELQVLA